MSWDTVQEFVGRYNGHTVRVVWSSMPDDVTFDDVFPGLTLTWMDYDTWQEAINRRDASPEDVDRAVRALATFGTFGFDSVTFEDGTTLDRNGWLEGPSGGYTVTEVYPYPVGSRQNRSHPGISVLPGYGTPESWEMHVAEYLNGEADYRTIRAVVYVDGVEVYDDTLGMVYEPKESDWRDLNIADYDIGEYVAMPDGDPAAGRPVVKVGSVPGLEGV